MKRFYCLRSTNLKLRRQIAGNAINNCDFLCRTFGEGWPFVFADPGHQNPYYATLRVVQYLKFRHDRLIQHASQFTVDRTIIEGYKQESVFLTAKLSNP